MNAPLILPIVCTALNPAIDKRLHLPKLTIGEVHRVAHMEATAGGKGLNVARVARALEAPVIASGFIGGKNGEWIREELTQAGIEQQWTAIAGETRTCLNLIDDSNGSSTEVLESGPPISQEESAAFVSLWRALCVPGRWMTLSGSLPRGLSPSFYSQLIEIARSKGASVVLDTSGVPLEKGVEAGPHTIKPNEQEFRQWTNSDPRDEKAMLGLAKELSSYGVKTIIVSLGREGCIAATADGRLLRAKAPVIHAINAVGSGDAFVAGWTVACARGMEMSDALRYASAAGASNAMSSGTGVIDPSLIPALAAEVQLTHS
ncbi:1-phosphofructokinase family hexose kinase [Cohnella endophytica]|uniref:Tagatose-6-phosphate kinase n=1 Tax=Cohnella endophytica TaxID=2419778 RepID=A0A494XQW6_9BACL|nr:1-phosphofructokinase family hexose kinase [Cohnella endophytica]RKP49913.1 1-phosphofructokinase family hexose kinase [Cohnella endophytica]